MPGEFAGLFIWRLRRKRESRRQFAVHPATFADFAFKCVLIQCDGSMYPETRSEPPDSW
jgi:hypothetical protein